MTKRVQQTVFSLIWFKADEYFQEYLALFIDHTQRLVLNNSRVIWQR